MFGWIKEYPEKTLKGKTKAWLIDYINCLVYNYKALDETTERAVEFAKDDAVKFLTENGYIVIEDLQKYKNKWVAFRQEGMEPILHGKVIRTFSITEQLTIKCKNGCNRYIHKNAVIGFYDNKKECYEVK